MANIYTIKIPTMYIDISETQKFSFKDFILWTISVHPNYNQDAAGIRAASRLDRKFDTEEPTEFDLDSEDLNRLKGAVEQPQGGYPIRPAHKVLPFVDAIVDAKMKK